MVSDAESLTLRLADDEVAALAQLLAAPGLFSTATAATAGGDLPAERIERARAALQERRLIAQGENGAVQVDFPVLALVGTCAHPAFSLHVTSLAGAAPPQERTFHQLAEMAVEHAVEADGTHTFTALASPRALLQRLAAVAHVGTQPRPEGGRIDCPAPALSDAWVAAANEGALGAMRRLRSDGLPRDTARALGVALDDARRVTQLAAFEHPPRGAVPRVLGSLTLVESPSGFWALTQSGPGAENLDVRPLSGADVAGVLAHAAASLRWTTPGAGRAREPADSAHA